MAETTCWPVEYEGVWSDGISIRFHNRPQVLKDLLHRVFLVLLQRAARGEIALREHLHACWETRPTRTAIDDAIGRLRRLVRRMSLKIVAVRERGFLLRHIEPEPDPPRIMRATKGTRRTLVIVPLKRILEKPPHVDLCSTFRKARELLEARRYAAVFIAAFDERHRRRALALLPIAKDAEVPRILISNDFALLWEIVRNT